MTVNAEIPPPGGWGHRSSSAAVRRRHAQQPVSLGSVRGSPFFSLETETLPGLDRLLHRQARCALVRMRGRRSAAGNQARCGVEASRPCGTKEWA
jgi:hypothetical protein